MEKASIHGLNSGFYKMNSGGKETRNVYLSITDDWIDIYSSIDRQPHEQKILSISVKTPDTLIIKPLVLRTHSLDVDITSIIFKYRPSVQNLPDQVITDLNMAMYIGWRHDRYLVTVKESPLGKPYSKIVGRGYDFGFFAGPGVTTISPFNTRHVRAEEYSGLILQSGMAGFIESNIASFGLSLGYDFLMNPDRKIWMYQNRPWVGFIVGIALN